MVSPTPRSQNRTSISPGLRTFTNSTFIPCLKSWCIEICSATACQPGSNSETNDNEVRIAHRNRRARHLAVRELDGEVVADFGLAHRAAKLEFVAIARLQLAGLQPGAGANHHRARDDSASQYQAATQRVPLPEISASEPSAFNSRTAKSASLAGKTHSTPSAPTPLCRSQMRRVKAWISTGSMGEIDDQEIIAAGGCFDKRNAGHIRCAARIVAKASRGISAEH